jgi:trimeric autotransporter adhesin
LGLSVAPATGASLNFPTGIAVDPSGNLFIADRDNNRIRKVNTTGIITTVAGNGTRGYSGDGGAATSTELNLPQAVAVDAVGNLYIADRNNHRIRKVTTNGIISTVAGNGTAGFSGDGGAATSARLNYPQAVAVDEAGNLYIADRDNNRIRKVRSNGTIITIAGNGTEVFSGDGGVATSAGVFAPQNIAVDGSGNVYLADPSFRIRKINTTGIISTVAGNGIDGYNGDGIAATNASLSFPRGMSIDGTGNLYISDNSNNRIRKVSTTGIISTVAGSTRGFSGDGGAATSAMLRGPYDVAVDAAGNLFIVDRANHRIRKVSSTPVPSITLGTIPSICPWSTSFTIPYTATTNNPDQYSVTGTGVSAGQSGPLSGSSGTITVNIDPATFTGSFTLVVTNTTSEAASVPVGSTVTTLASCPVISIKTGNWEDPATWNVGRVPLAGEPVILDEGHIISIHGTGMAQTLDYRLNAKLLFIGASSTLKLGQ